jgi:hypothetical protein
MEDLGDTGNEIDSADLEEGMPIKVKPNVVPVPTLAPIEDSKKKPSRAMIVDEE